VPELREGDDDENTYSQENDNDFTPGVKEEVMRWA
jgi:hypothetical protein